MAEQPLGALLRRFAGELRDAGMEDGSLEARLLLAHAMSAYPDHLRLQSDRLVGNNVVAAAMDLTSRRKAGCPVAHLTGTREFWSLEFQVTPDVLIPRADTETVVETVLATRPDRRVALRILDLGTGSGCLLAALLHEYPFATGLGVDLSPAALDIAGRNLATLGLGMRGSLRPGAWYTGLVPAFDIIVSNPPYIAPDVIAMLDTQVRDHEPRLALDGGPDGLTAYRDILGGASAHLSPGGLLAVEIGYDQSEAVQALARKAGLDNVAVHNDLAGHPRVVSANGSAK